MKTLFAAPAAVLALVGAAAFAQAGYGPDANGDGKITLQEMQSARESRLMQADANADGKISKDEYLAYVKDRMARFGGGRGPGGGPGGGRFGGGGPGGSPEDRFMQLDQNSDGFVTKAEIDKATATQFAAMDTDHKGYISMSQMRGAFRGRR